MTQVAAVKSRRVRPSVDSEQENLIREFTPVIKAIANRLSYRLPAHLDAEDLMSAGIIGLMDAMTKFDPTREAKFKTYAEFRIRGAMLDEIRSMDWIPRSVHQRITLLQKTHASLVWKLGRPPTDEETALALNMTVQELDDFLTRSQGAILISIEDLGIQDGDGSKIVKALVDTVTPDPLSMVVSEDVRKMLAEAIQQLPEKERMVLTLYYFEELTMKEIGQILKVTESRVCQIHSKAVLTMKSKLQTII